MADALKAPIVHALRGKKHIEYDDPFDVGPSELLGFSSSYFAIMNWDVLLMPSTDFPYQQFCPEQAGHHPVGPPPGKFRASHPARSRSGRSCAIRSRQSFRSWSQTKDRAHLDKAVKHYIRNRADLDDLVTGTPGRRPIRPQYLTSIVNELAMPNL